MSCVTNRAHLGYLKESHGQTGYSPGHARLDDPDDPGARAPARLRHLAAPRGSRPRPVSGEPGLAVSLALPAGAGWPAEGRVAADREQPAREILPPDRGRPEAARTGSRPVGPG